MHIEDLKSEILDRNLITITTDISGIITDVSKGFEALFGYAKDELIGFTHQIISHPDTPSEIFTHLWSTITKGNSWCGEIKNQNKSGVAYWSKICIEPLKKEDTILGFMGIYTNITEQKELIRQTMTDPLTGIYNRSKCNLLLIQMAEQSYRNENTFSLLFIDLDHVKHINDKYGHLEGDRILIEFTTVVRDTLRSSDIFCRWGGEEFVILLASTNSNNAYAIAEKLRNRIQEHNFNLDESITLSIGVSQHYPSKSIHHTIESADKAMYKAKRLGRNQTAVANEDDL